MPAFAVVLFFNPPWASKKITEFRVSIHCRKNLASGSFYPALNTTRNYFLVVSSFRSCFGIKYKIRKLISRKLFFDFIFYTLHDLKEEPTRKILHTSYQLYNRKQRYFLPHSNHCLITKGKWDTWFATIMHNSKKCFSGLGM